MNKLELKEKFIQKLNYIYDRDEATNLMWWSIQELTGKHKKQLLAIDDFDLIDEHVNEVIEKLASGKPIQYIFKKTYFFDLEFYVDENVLIPRPETEELVHWIISDNTHHQNISIIDLCTGSGCIAISLKQKLQLANVSAIDISQKAIEVAEKNAVNNRTEINFLNSDIFNFSSNENFDVLVSNPPYVCNKEKNLMHKNVLDHEPHLALFVDDDNALIFYKTIANFGITNLKHNGKVYLEINENLAAETSQIFYDLGYKLVEIKKDINGKDRMLKIHK
jgi:release factor glutamine methyltransferase